MKQWDPKFQPYVKKGTQSKKTSSLSPPAILFVGFIVLIILGSILLMLPIASNQVTGIIDAIFTATSAVTVTGLVVVDTGTHFTLFGQVVIAILIQAGGLGFMTFAVVAALSLGAKLGLSQTLLVKEALGQTSLEKVTQTAKYVVLYSFVIEAVGIALLTVIWASELPFSTALYHAFFYTVSAFNNAGFALSADSLTRYADSWQINGVISALFMIGGIGFTVLIDIKQKKRWKKLSINTRLVIKATLIINVCAFFLIWLLEAKNPYTLGAMSVGDQIIAAWFQAVTPRTAGFNTLPVDQLTDATTTLTIFLMFIGGGSLSTASGIKLGTFVVLVMATIHFLRRNQRVALMQRTVPQEQVMKALSLALVSIAMIFISIFVLTAIEKAPFLDIVFEVVSALSTVGLSRGVTGNLSPAGEVIIIFLMIIGRVGPLTFAYFLALPNPQKLKFANAEIQVG
ncbi:TrkH family potassium uptake protein [Paraglaciecola aquimarina]|uniref:TrkH family potassium uptake protein n=1 Tax=Paraglaciecola aquimarina TaxID=1235557 RepID=A0ABU3SRI5_9ALTE|nr:TrkH family potassium uptake protein [Paraglaciecola aquimarina]MDU0352611.1 TrkH family potassium uptake protein [Paraglaciecola aquimarina]